MEEQNKFVAAQTGQQVGLSEAGGEALGRLDEKFIADGVAVIVVDVLEPIQIDEGQRKSL